MTFRAHESKNSGFTLIELLVAIAIIGILSSVVLSSLNSAREKARDTRRKSDLNQIRTALILYNEDYGNYMETGSGCGSNGNGWFSLYNGTSYPKAMGICLYEAGLTPQEIIDPTRGTSSTPTAGYTYMKYTCGSPKKTYIYAKLEGTPQSITATDGTCCATCDSSYGMNYYITLE